MDDSKLREMKDALMFAIELTESRKEIQRTTRQAFGLESIKQLPFDMYDVYLDALYMQLSS